MNPTHFISSLAIALLFPLTTAAAPIGETARTAAVQPAPTDDIAPPAAYKPE